jgi:hypothetical protein
MGRGIKTSGFTRRGLTVVAGLAVVAGSLVGFAAPANASISGASISPSTWAASAQDAAVVTWTESSATANTANSRRAYNYDTNLTGQFLSVEVGWGWVMANKAPTATTTSPVTYAASWTPATNPATGGTYTCATTGITFSSPGFSNSGGALNCLITVSSTYVGNPGQMVVLSNITGTSYFSLTAGSEITVTFPSGQITAPAAGPASDSWRINSLSIAQTTTVTTVVPGADGVTGSLVTIDFDSNGGTCSTAKVQGIYSSWGVAPDATDCTRARYNFAGYNTSADGSGISIAPGGNINFTGDNRVYAQWVDPRAAVVTAGAPTNVVATSKWQRVQVNWEAPASSGTYPITNYLVQATPGGSVCVTRLTDKKLTQCSFNNITPGTKYTFKVQALTGAGWGPMSAVSNAASPYELRVTGSDRKKGGLFQLFKSEAKVNGTAKGYPAGTRIHSWYKLGDGAWAEGSEVKSDASGNFKWSKKFERKYDGTTIQVRFSAEPLGSPWIKNAKYNSESMDFSNIVTVGKAK